MTNEIEARVGVERLLERVKAASGPDRDLEWDIQQALFGIEQTDFHGTPRYTASIDAALALVERVLPGSWYVLAKGRLSEAEPLYACELLLGQDEQLGIAEGQNQPLAIIAATLTALIAKATP